MTEAASMITANPLDGPRKAGSAGCPGTEVRVVAGTGTCSGRARPARLAGCRSGDAGSSRSTRRAARSAPRRGRLARHRRPWAPGPRRLSVPGRPLRRRDQPGRREDLPAGDRGVPAHPARGPSAAVVAASDEVLGQRPVAYVIPATDPAGPDLAGPHLAGPDLAGPHWPAWTLWPGRIWLAWSWRTRCARRARRNSPGPRCRPSSAW